MQLLGSEARWTLALAVICAALVASHPGAAQDPEFRSSVTQIEVDVFVTDSRGNFVRDLRREEIEVFEDGQPQQLSAFSLVDLPVPPRSQERLSVEGDVTGNAPTANGRLWVMLLDTPSGVGTGSPIYTRRTQNVARRFVEEAMAPGDMMAVVHVQGTSRSSQALTQNKRLLLDSIERFSRGSSNSGPETSIESVTRVADTLRVIEELSERLGAISSRRKAVLWIGGQMPFQLGNAAAALPFAYRDAIRAAQRNNVAIYSVEPGGLGSLNLTDQAALRAISEDTGGEAIVNTNEFINGFSRIVRDNSTYYLLGYSPRVQHLDGQFHSITVRVKRPGVTVRARRGYLAPDRAAVERSRAAAAAIPPVIDALRSPIPRTDLDLNVMLAPFKGARGGTVVLGASVSGESLRGDERAADLAYRVIDTDGKILIERSGRRQITLTPAAAPGRQDFTFQDRFDVPRGRHEIRFGARLGDKIGTVVAYVEVPDFGDKALALSGLLVGPRPVGQSLDGLVTSLAERQFRAIQTLNVAGALYARRNVQIDRAVIDVTVRDAEGNTVFATSNEASGLPTDDLKDRRFSVDVPLSQLTPGTHVLIVKAYVRGNERNAATRDVTFRIAD
jgi:VWFA-related protein